MFRYKVSVPLSYDRQGYIFFASRLYREMPPSQRKVIEDLCRRCGREYEKALFDFVTSEAGATAVCLKHHLSESTLYRIVRKYYMAFPKRL